MSAEAIIRPIRDEDVPACAALAWDAISAQVPVEFLTRDDGAVRTRRNEARMRRFLELDPGGCWTAEVDGRPVATALAMVREGVWGLSLFGVEPGFQAQGIGRRVLDAALAYGDGCRGAIICATLDARALRRYARAGFTLHPTLAGCGIVDRHAAPDRASLRSRETTWDDPALVAAARDLSRHVRGASHAGDLEGFALYEGTPIVLDGEGWAIRDGDGSPTVLAARDSEAARDLLWACLLGGTPGATLHVDWLTGQQPWAVDVVLQAGLPLSADGAVCVRGDLGPMTPYLPSGVYL
ncbi:GNAT family N-acetyltransferase [Paraconexibacter sp.]|uniref:GNAT family N-acetyltransferase n=1 Tax=Paraconexibacter sp. TaxID=2949640 RepID=UPI003566346F